MNRAGWLRAAVLGANDGLLSTGSLMAGVAAAQADARMLLVTGVAAIVAGALSMATGEYVSVSSQADSEKADLRREKRALHERPHAELDELTAIYEERGWRRRWRGRWPRRSPRRARWMPMRAMNWASRRATRPIRCWPGWPRRPLSWRAGCRCWRWRCCLRARMCWPRSSQ
jgi:hypothetical protein